MKVPLEISFRGVDKTDDLERLIHEKSDKLEKICDTIISCRVAVERPQAHQQTGNPFRVRINLRLPPGKDLTVKRESSEGHLHDKLPVVISDAFDTAFRRLKKQMAKQQGQVKMHPEQEKIAFVVRLFNDEGYGFIKSIDGRELYFHRNSVLNDDFDRLEIGTGVRYVAEAGDEGPKASTIQIVDKPGGSAAETDAG
jgi:cold shock CspA family protein/ribosome-associated translation inhibitor RaiA